MALHGHRGGQRRPARRKPKTQIIIGGKRRASATGRKKSASGLSTARKATARRRAIRTRGPKRR